METLRYVILVNGLLAVVSIAFYVLLRRETFFSANRLALWLGLAGTLILPSLELPDWRPQPVRTVMQRTAQVIVPRVLPETYYSRPDVTITFPNQKTYRAFQIQPTQFVWSWQVGMAALYIIGVLVLLMRLGFQIVSLQRLIRQSVLEPYNDFVLVKNESVTSPFSFFSWVVLNLDQYTSTELEQILRHERVHVREWHSLDMVGAELVRIFFWFNPAAYLFRHLLHQILEFQADYTVLAEGIDARTYQYNLLRVGLLAGQSGITNQFSNSSLRQRIRMINGRRSGSLAWYRYAAWALIMGIMAFACRHKNTDYEGSVFRRSAFPITNITRALASELDQPGMPWFRQASLLVPDKTSIIDGRQVTEVVLHNYPDILCLRNNHLSFKNTDSLRTKLFINGQKMPTTALSGLTFEEITDLLVYQKWEDAPGAEKYQESYRVFVSKTHMIQKENPLRIRWKQFLLANAISDHPLGNSNTFSMNKLLEATFFRNKLAFVQRTKDNYLKLYDEYITDIDLYINGLPVSSKDIESIHVREVDKLYTRERSFLEWTNVLNRQHRFILYVQTSPERAKRDSSYYVFSPFYSGDF